MTALRTTRHQHQHIHVTFCALTPPSPSRSAAGDLARPEREGGRRWSSAPVPPEHASLDLYTEGLTPPTEPRCRRLGRRGSSGSAPTPEQLIHTQQGLSTATPRQEDRHSKTAAADHTRALGLVTTQRASEHRPRTGHTQDALLSLFSGFASRAFSRPRLPSVPAARHRTGQRASAAEIAFRAPRSSSPSPRPSFIHFSVALFTPVSSPPRLLLFPPRLQRPGWREDPPGGVNHLQVPGHVVQRPLLLRSRHRRRSARDRRDGTARRLCHSLLISLPLFLSTFFLVYFLPCLRSFISAFLPFSLPPCILPFLPPLLLYLPFFPPFISLLLLTTFPFFPPPFLPSTLPPSFPPFPFLPPFLPPSPCLLLFLPTIFLPSFLPTIFLPSLFPLSFLLPSLSLPPFFPLSPLSSFLFSFPLSSPFPSSITSFHSYYRRP
ncbi:hypothetical protein C7M84_024473 [Penaeus vannamei]|uniref:Uncharacterized protein n=1 Tax=Penaeus vannamei TaxID=6689 RepID=A0A423U0Y5_PENVA|nr:hypothetical protein C7M84_024473 [Penaeus vannamei]